MSREEAEVHNKKIEGNFPELILSLPMVNEMLSKGFISEEILNKTYISTYVSSSV